MNATITVVLAITNLILVAIVIDITVRMTTTLLFYV